MIILLLTFLHSSKLTNFFKMVYYGSGIDVSFVKCWSRFVERANLKSHERARSSGAEDNFVDLGDKKAIDKLRREIVEIFQDHPKTFQFYRYLSDFIVKRRYVDKVFFPRSFFRFWSNLVLEMNQASIAFEKEQGKEEIKIRDLYALPEEFDIVEGQIENIVIDNQHNAIVFYRNINGLWLSSYSVTKIELQYFP